MGDQYEENFKNAQGYFLSPKCPQQILLGEYLQMVLENPNQISRVKLLAWETSLKPGSEPAASRWSTTQWSSGWSRSSTTGAAAGRSHSPRWFFSGTEKGRCSNRLKMTLQLLSHCAYGLAWSCSAFGTSCSAICVEKANSYLDTFFILETYWSLSFISMQTGFCTF